MKNCIKSKEKQIFLLLIFIVLLLNVSVGRNHVVQQASNVNESMYPGKISNWKGFDKYSFPFLVKQWSNDTDTCFAEIPDTIPAHLIVPTKALPGNPWVWRARFPNWHTEMDSILLSKGFHIAYVNTNNRFGSPKAMCIWDCFYKYLTREILLSEKVSLEGVSRGGLFVYGWAKRNPEKVNCIYTEAPVCDFLSWPAGFGNFVGHKETWTRLKREFGFSSEQEAKLWPDQPYDNLEELAKAKVPVLHMVSLEDVVVPPQENSFKLIERYISLGGPATIIPCSKMMKKNSKGHHFYIESPELGADFIIYNTK